MSVYRLEETSQYSHHPSTKPASAKLSRTMSYRLSFLLAPSRSRDKTFVDSIQSVIVIRGKRTDSSRAFSYNPCPAHDFDTLNTVVKRCMAISSRFGQEHIVITVDQALYYRLMELKWSLPQYQDKVIPRLSGLHVSMNFLKAIGDHMCSIYRYVNKFNRPLTVLFQTDRADLWQPMLCSFQDLRENWILAALILDDRCCNWQNIHVVHVENVHHIRLCCHFPCCHRQSRQANSNIYMATGNGTNLARDPKC